MRLIECRCCDATNCEGCNMFTLAQMLQGGELDCLMDEHHSIVIAPESLRPKGRWKYYNKQNIAVCTNCSFERDLNANLGKAIGCPNCGADMRGGTNE